MTANDDADDDAANDRIKMIRIRMKHFFMLDVFPIALAGGGGHVIKSSFFIEAEMAAK